MKPGADISSTMAAATSRRLRRTHTAPNRKRANTVFALGWEACPAR